MEIQDLFSFVRYRSNGQHFIHTLQFIYTVTGLCTAGYHSTKFDLDTVHIRIDREKKKEKETENYRTYHTLYNHIMVYLAEKRY